MGGILLADVRTAFMLLNHGRYRLLEGLGVAHRDVNLVSLVVAATGLESFGGMVRHGTRALAKPASGDTLLGAGIADELLGDLIGPAARRVPHAGALIALALVTKRSGPALRHSAQEVGAFSRRTTSAFHHRYGYLIAARARRARERARGG